MPGSQGGEGSRLAKNRETEGSTMEPAFRGPWGEMGGKRKDHRDFLGDSGECKTEQWGTVSKTSRFGAPEPVVCQSHSKSRKLGCGAF